MPSVTAVRASLNQSAAMSRHWTLMVRSSTTESRYCSSGTFSPFWYSTIPTAPVWETGAEPFGILIYQIFESVSSVQGHEVILGVRQGHRTGAALRVTSLL